MSTPKPPLYPTDVQSPPGWFDRFSDAVAGITARAWFFVLCVVLVLVWAPSYWLFGSLDTWQLIINTATTIITFLLVALLQNTASRADRAVQRKLNAIAEALVELRDTLSPPDATSGHEVSELRAAVGLENREGST